MAVAERQGRRLILAVVVACLAGCAADEAPEAPSHRCRVIPTGMVECVPVNPVEGERPR